MWLLSFVVIKFSNWKPPLSWKLLLLLLGLPWKRLVWIHFWNGSLSSWRSPRLKPTSKSGWFNWNLFNYWDDYDFRISTEFVNIFNFDRVTKGYDAKGQLISKANLEVFIWTKKQQKYYCMCFCLSFKNP